LYRSRKSEEPKDWNLNQTVAHEIDRVGGQRRTWPFDLMGGNRHYTKKPNLAMQPNICQAILHTECILKNDDPVR
jgi:hypothetical protein